MNRAEAAVLASAARKRNAARRRHEAWAAEMREHGWTVTPPSDGLSESARSRMDDRFSDWSAESEVEAKLWFDLVGAFAQSRRGEEPDSWANTPVADIDVDRTDRIHALYVHQLGKPSVSTLRK